jgi:hypothetical protein
MGDDNSLREHLVRVLDWRSAHADFDAAIQGIPMEKRGQRPADLPYSPWELVEHMRIAQRDILEFCRDAEYTAPDWPVDYWPGAPEPPGPAAWKDGIEAFRSDRAGMKDIVRDPAIDLHAEIPHGEGQTYLREVLLVADHNAYHLGQLVTVRRLLGIWEDA